MSQQQLTFEQKKTSYEWVMGIDEAGRGPVIGPMVYGCCIWPITNTNNKKHENDKMENEGFNDSKALTIEKREALFARMQELQDDELHFEVYIDTVGNKETYQKKLENDYHKQYPQIKFCVKEKADADFPVVGAASICAKVIRDKEIENQEIEKNSVSLGSGYPSDPQTKKWLQNNFDGVFGFGNMVRFSWSTVENIFKERGVFINFFEDKVQGNGCFQQFLIQKEKKMYFQGKLDISIKLGTFSQTEVHMSINFRKFL
ncbi:ribonuclease large subunit, putative [Ichthyophthirius multifiliis]|uniref:Ribonuclease n=1 Tax=Ichthyophthirius multifiliis TaxID=5932 RepID=G0R1P8_ICHMU|nr:ribonuclease large subunit, putative [Ichthyophthirius multifiliis]EGR28608.1 ribonuclease large subunit, putative [Ichthyophthirius multifiliis]|eukprot:XP_004029844.1 ribonuclease large subunit, putative [Ichthyophthirius multifiliis]